MTDNFFTKLNDINISDKMEKKGKFNYLSWAHAVTELGKIDPAATWSIIRFDGLPYLKTETGFYVEVAVTVRSITKTQIHPVLDNYNKVIQKPNAFQINTSIQRCLAKAIALHGLGLYLFIGEDLPEVDKPPTKAELKIKWNKTNSQLFIHFQNEDVTGIHEVLNEVEPSDKKELWGLIPSEVKKFITDNKEAA